MALPLSRTSPVTATRYVTALPATWPGAGALNGTVTMLYMYCTSVKKKIQEITGTRISTEEKEVNSHHAPSNI